MTVAQLFILIAKLAAVVFVIYFAVVASRNGLEQFEQNVQNRQTISQQ